MSHVDQTSSQNRHDLVMPTSTWLISHDHARAVLGAALGETQCACGTNATAASHHKASCPYRLVLESAQILSVLATADATHYQGHASLAEMVSAHAPAFRALISRAARGEAVFDPDHVGQPGNGDANVAVPHPAHVLDALADIEKACRIDIQQPAAVAVRTAQPRTTMPVAWKTTHKAVCVPITEDAAIADMWRNNGYEVIELCQGATTSATGETAVTDGADACNAKGTGLTPEQIATALVACDLSNVSIGDKAIILAAIGRLREGADGTVVAAARAVVREALDDVNVHPCDEHNDAIRARSLPEPMRDLWLALSGVKG